MTSSLSPSSASSPTASALSRRGFLGAGAASGLGIVFAGSIDAVAGTAANAATRSAAGYGPLVTDPAGILSLPKGFSYKIVAEAGKTVMDAGDLTPAVFAITGPWGRASNAR